LDFTMYISITCYWNVFILSQKIMDD